MYKIPDDMTKIEVLDASVDFYKYEENSLTYYFFDSSLTTPPDPMVNALLGLQLLDNKNKRLIMINHCIPNALFPRISTNFDFEIENLQNNIKIEFKSKS